MDRYREIYEAQGGKCAICRIGGDLVIDHHSETGLVRALLCGRCNTGLGFFRENADYMRAAAAYIEAQHRITDAIPRISGREARNSHPSGALHAIGSGLGADRVEA